jgi:hypothetical protein
MAFHRSITLEIIHADTEASKVVTWRSTEGQ